MLGVEHFVADGSVCVFIAATDVSAHNVMCHKMLHHKHSVLHIPCKLHHLYPPGEGFLLNTYQPTQPNNIIKYPSIKWPRSLPQPFLSAQDRVVSSRVIIFFTLKYFLTDHFISQGKSHSMVSNILQLTSFHI